MVKDEKNKCINILNKKLISFIKNKYILPNKRLKKLNLDRNKV